MTATAKRNLTYHVVPKIGDNGPSSFTIPEGSKGSLTIVTFRNQKTGLFVEFKGYPSLFVNYEDVVITGL